MITTVTPNPCIDKTLSVAHFETEKTNRATLLRTEVGGKGINVAAAVTALGGSALCGGFDFCSDAASKIASHLEALGIAHDLVRVTGELRCCTKIFDQSRNTMIEVNECGESVTDADVKDLCERIASLAKKSSFIVLSGSLPKGMPKSFYADCVALLHRTAPHCRVVVDAEGESLLKALDEKPFLIKPNENEFATAFGVTADLPNVDRIADQLIREQKAECICVSLGDRGAYLADASGRYFAPALSVNVRSLQGAGDAMVAGICLAFEQGLAAPEALAWGVAASATAISHEGTAFGTREEFDAWLADVKVEKLF